MANSKLHELSGVRVFKANGTLASGAKLYIYNANTTDLQTLYSDSELENATTNPIEADGNGLLPYFYVGTTPYKNRLEESDGTLIDEQDDIPGALDTESLSTEFAKPDTSVSVKTNDYTVQTADLGGVLQCDPTSGSFDLTLPSAITATNGRGISVLHVGTGNTVTIKTVSSQTISWLGSAATSKSLEAYGQSISIVSNGANWIAVSDAGQGFDADVPIIVKQGTAPTGWTKDVSTNEHAIRIVSGTPSTGGSVAFATAFSSTRTPAGTIGGSSLTIAQLAAHTHPYTSPSSGPGGDGGASVVRNSTNSTTGSTGSGQAHTHSFTGAAMNFAVKYTDFCIVTKI